MPTSAPEFEALILAGGESRRMGRNKSLLPYGGVTLIEHILNQLRTVTPVIRISTNDGAAFSHLHLPLVPDLVPGQGPLMGIASGLVSATRPWVLVVATDIPELPLDILPELWAASDGHRCVVPRDETGRLQPHFGLYHRELGDSMLDMLGQGRRGLVDFALCAGAATVPLASARLLNLNDLAAFEAAREGLSGRQ